MDFAAVYYKWPGANMTSHKDSDGNIVIEEWDHQTKKTKPSLAELKQAQSDYETHLKTQKQDDKQLIKSVMQKLGMNKSEFKDLVTSVTKLQGLVDELD